MYIGLKCGVSEPVLERFLEREVQEMELLLATLRNENRICASECNRLVNEPVAAKPPFVINVLQSTSLCNQVVTVHLLFQLTYCSQPPFVTSLLQSISYFSQFIAANLL